MDLLGDLSFDNGVDTGMPTVDVVPAGGYDAGTLGQYADTSLGMPSYAPDYGGGALTTGLSNYADSTAATPPSSGGYSTAGLGFTNGQQPGSTTAASTAAAAAPEKQAALAKMLGMKATADGSATDWSNPKTIAQLTKALGVGGSLLNMVMTRGKQANAQTGQQLLGQLQSNAHNNWNPNQQAAADQFFNQKYTPAWQRPAMPQTANVVTGYATGGPVDQGEPQGPLSGGMGVVAHDGTGQADDVPVNLSGGEYVIPADVVAALGDGNNAAGSKILDQWVQEVRKRARSSGPGDNPPPAQAPDDYLGGGQQ